MFVLFRDRDPRAPIRPFRSIGARSWRRQAALRSRAAQVRPRRPFAVGLRVLRLVDHSRVIRLPGGRVVPRTLITDVWYRALGRPSHGAAHDAPAARAVGPFGLIVFAHGFGLTPGTYRSLLQAWARVGYVVAAPAFPGEGKRTRRAKQVGSRQRAGRHPVRHLSAASRERLHSRPCARFDRPTGSRRRRPFRRSSSGSRSRLRQRPRTARTRSRDPCRRSARRGASPVFRHDSPALLAIQGTAETVQAPAATHAFFALARPPRFLLQLLGAGHESPYELPRWRHVLARVGTAFFDRYLRRRQPGALGRLLRAGRDAGTSSLTARP